MLKLFTIIILVLLLFGLTIQTTSAQCNGATNCYQYTPPYGYEGNVWGYNFYDSWITPSYNGYWPTIGYYEQYDSRYYPKSHPYYYSLWGQKQGPRYWRCPQAGQDHYYNYCR